MAKRKIFLELMKGVAAMQAQREGKISLHIYSKGVKQGTLSAKNGAPGQSS
jgi:hypothetical protein